MSLVPGELFAPDVIPCPPTTWADTYKVRSSCHRSKPGNIGKQQCVPSAPLYKIILFFMALFTKNINWSALPH